MAGGLAVGIDIGGTKLAGGLVDGEGNILARARVVTPRGDPKAIVDAAADMVADLVPADADGVPVGVGAAGLVDLEGVVRFAPNVVWRDEPLASRLRERLGGPVTVDNDANAAAWGEFRCGAGRKASTSMLMLTLGTGVGGGLVVGERIVRGANGLAAEFGHLLVVEGGPHCPCGNRGCLEAVASGTAIGRRAQERLKAGEVTSGSELYGLAKITGKTVTLAAQAGDPDARAILAETGTWLGVGIASLVNALDPQIVVVGGGAMEAGELVLGPAREAFVDRILGGHYRAFPPIVRAALGDDGGIVGAALQALDSRLTI